MKNDLAEIVSLLKQSALPIAGIERHIETTVVARDNGKITGCAAVEVYGTRTFRFTPEEFDQRFSETFGYPAF